MYKHKIFYCEARISGTSAENLGLARHTVTDTSHYDFETNLFYRTDGTIKNSVAVARITSDPTNGITEFEQILPFKAVDYNEAVVKSDLKECQVVVETYQNGTSWYRVYSDGWIEQGGIATGGTSKTGATINLLKPYTSTNYNITGSIFRGEALVNGAPLAVVFISKTNSSFNASTMYGGGSPAFQAYNYSWYACGY